MNFKDKVVRKWSYERVANIGALITTIQSIVGLAFCLHFLEVFLNQNRLKPNEVDEIPFANQGRVILHHLTKDSKNLIVGMLFFAGIFHLVWMCSSLYLIIGNRDGNEKAISQYLIVSFLIGLMDFVFPFLILGTTYTMFGTAIQGSLATSPFQIEGSDTTFSVVMQQENFGSYFWLLMTFIRGGCFSFAVNSFITWVAYKRFSDLRLLKVLMRRNRGVVDPGQEKLTTCVDVPRPLVEKPVDMEDPEVGGYMLDPEVGGDGLDPDLSVEDALNEVYDPSDTENETLEKKRLNQD